MNEQLFSDHSTFRGQLEVRFKRFKGFLRTNWMFIIPIILIVTVVCGYLTAANVTPKELPASLPGALLREHSQSNSKESNYKPNLLKSTSRSDALTFEGNREDQEEKLFDELSKVENPKNVSSLTLRHVEIDGPSFTKALEMFENLETLVLDNVTVQKLLVLARINLPKLKYFSADLRVDKFSRAKHVHGYKQKEILESVVFFEKNVGKEKGHTKSKDKDHIPDFDKDLTNLGVDLRVSLEGSKLLKVNKTKGELMLNFPNCEEVLKNVKWNVKVLTIASCSVSESTFKIHNELKYLNLNDVKLSNQELSEILKSQSNLTELLVRIPKRTINLSDIPKTLKFFSASEMNVKSKDGQVVHSVKEFIINNGVLEEKIISNFSGTFPNVETVGLFDVKHQNQKFRHDFLKNVLKSGASRIYVGNWTVDNESEKEHYENGTLTIDGESESEGYLEEIEIPKHSKHFVITLPPKGDHRIGIPLSVHETRFFHFTLSEQSKVWSYKEYLKVVIGKKN